jgi:hypothetical protein
MLLMLTNCFGVLFVGTRYGAVGTINVVYRYRTDIFFMYTNYLRAWF